MDPCAVSRLFAKKGIILKPFVIGIGLDKSWQDNLDCVGTFLMQLMKEIFQIF